MGRVARERSRHVARFLCAVAMLVCSIVLPGTRAHAQVVPNARYRTLDTPHFRIHYTPDLDSLARRTAVSAERAWVRLSRELVAPRGPVDLVIGDNVDYSTGFATTYPSNRITLYATPPLQGTLRNYADWLDLVVTHELTHIFHLDRSRGIWRLAQRVFGRNPALFPNAYSPSWLTEGLAVYYETRLTGSGRLAGTAHRVQALAAAAGGGSPGLDQLSAATPAFPGGSSAYVWGSLAVEQLATRGGDAGVRRFVDGSAGQIIPFRLNHVARNAFGETFSTAWARWRDSLAREAEELRVDSAFTLVGKAAWDAAAPRWTTKGAAVAWPATFPRAVPALWIADSTGHLRRVARRNTLDVNAPRLDGGFVYAQLEFTDPFHVRSDLWLADAGGDRRRLTHDARLLQPDVSADGAIVAVQIVDGTTRLVRLSERDVRLEALTTTHADTQWSEPRWGAGAELVAVRRIRGGRAEVVRIDSARVVTVLASSDRVEASPSWSRDGCAVYSVTDRRGQPEPLRVPLPCAGDARPTLALIGAAPGTAGIVALDADAWSQDDERLAAIGIGATGFRLALREGASSATDVVAAVGDSLGDARIALLDTAAHDAAGAPSHAYSPWRMLVPRWWLPLVGETDEGTTMLGAYSSGSDIVGKHLWAAQAAVPLSHPEEWEGGLSWRWRGLGQPAIDLSVVQEWDAGGVRARSGDSVVRVGRFARSDRVASVGATIVRPRIYSNASLSAGAEYEWVGAVRTDPDSLLGRLPADAIEPFALPGAYVAATWSALQRAPQAVSAEDGVSIGTTYRERWQGAYDLPNGRTVVGVLRGYKSLDLPGYAKHVLATRISGAWASDASLESFDVGGTSGSSLEVLPGITVGDASRTFGVRGFPPGYLSGNQAFGSALEYRAPLLLANRGVDVSPFYLSRTGLTLFGEAASAWCVRTSRRECVDLPDNRPWIASLGAEVWLDASASYDVPYRVRFGVAAPVRSQGDAGSSPEWLDPHLYISFGAAF